MLSCRTGKSPSYVTHAPMVHLPVASARGPGDERKRSGDLRRQRATDPRTGGEEATTDTQQLSRGTRHPTLATTASERCGRPESGLPRRVTSGLPSRVTSGLPSRVTRGLPSRVTSGLPRRVTSGLPRGYERMEGGRGDFFSAELCAFRRVPATQQVCFWARRASMI